MVSVMAVKIQFSSPSGVLRSFSRPGILGDTCVSISDGGQSRLRTQVTETGSLSPRQGAAHGEEPLALPRLELHSENSPASRFLPVHI